MADQADKPMPTTAAGNQPAEPGYPLTRQVFLEPN